MTAPRSVELLRRLVPEARQSLQRIMAGQRDTLWGSTEIKLRVRKYPKSGQERVSVVKPQLNRVKLYSHVLKTFVPVRMTPEMLRAVERRGGLDDYLLSTPDGALHSNAASTLRWQVLCELAKKREAEAAASVASRGSGNPEGRRAALRDLKPKA
uniref:Ribosomal protein L28 n=1 Tax=Chlamydomonas euryale TaxID=1486919 RepID=A0A7R9UZS2_9CHLO|mmetsp:Transcript_10236/g.30879  ORF Transcript_10236/g.30879 Transcript_10236/m.30879 type:complete len:155 (+) Transcript_10236:590-1054(+)